MALTNDDKKFITDTVKSTVNIIFKEDRKHLKIYLDDLFDTKLEKKVKQYVGNLPTKEEFNSRMDEMMGELKAVREEQALLAQHDVDQQDQIDLLKNIHPDYTHVTLASDKKKKEGVKYLQMTAENIEDKKKMLQKRSIK